METMRLAPDQPNLKARRGGDVPGKDSTQTSRRSHSPGARYETPMDSVALPGGY